MHHRPYFLTLRELGSHKTPYMKLKTGGKINMMGRSFLVSYDFLRPKNFFMFLSLRLLDEPVLRC